MSYKFKYFSFKFDRVKFRILDYEKLFMFQYYHIGRNMDFDSNNDNPLAYTTPCTQNTYKKQKNCWACNRDVKKQKGLLAYIQMDNGEILLINKPCYTFVSSIKPFLMENFDKKMNHWIICKKSGYGFDVKYEFELGEKIPKSEIKEMNSDILSKYTEECFNIKNLRKSYAPDNWDYKFEDNTPF